jgi:formylmethanofuran dehydrogenase subunit B
MDHEANLTCSEDIRSISGFLQVVENKLEDTTVKIYLLTDVQEFTAFVLMVCAAVENIMGFESVVNIGSGIGLNLKYGGVPSFLFLKVADMLDMTFDLTPDGP